MVTSIKFVEKIRRSKRLNVVQSSEPYANGSHNSSEQVLPQCEPVLQVQALGDDDIQVEQQDDDDLNLSGTIVMRYSKN